VRLKQVAVQGEVGLTMEKCVLTKSSNCGLHVLKNCAREVRITGCEFSQSCYFGVKAAACLTTVHLEDCSVKDNRQYGTGVIHTAAWSHASAECTFSCF
jgi:hypothetical protein